MLEELLKLLICTCYWPSNNSSHMTMDSVNVSSGNRLIQPQLWSSKYDNITFTNAIRNHPLNGMNGFKMPDLHCFLSNGFNGSLSSLSSNSSSSSSLSSSSTSSPQSKLLSSDSDYGKMIQEKLMLKNGKTINSNDNKTYQQVSSSGNSIQFN